MIDNKQLQLIAANIRKHVVTAVHNAKSGHPGGSLSISDIITEIYFEQMNVTKETINDPKRDRFVLSKGHCSPALYGALAEKGIIPKEDIKLFRKDNTYLQGHPSMKDVPGVDMSTGSLGQGISAACGIALAGKIDNLDYRVYSILGDGECEEGQVWEAMMFGAHYKLDNLCAVLDNNGLQIDGDIQKVIGPAPFEDKFNAFGWNVINVDAHDFDSLRDGFNKAKECKGKPSILIAKSIKGKGVSFMENKASWHGVAPNDEELEIAISELNKQILDLGGNI